MSGMDIARLVISIVACQGAGGIGAAFTSPAIPTWYAGLKKPALLHLIQPSHLFGSLFTF